jgi:subtilisin family serine protease
MGAFCRVLAVAGLLAFLSASSAFPSPDHAGTRVLSYRSPEALRTFLGRTGFRVKRNLPALHSVELAGATVGAPPVGRYPNSQPQSTEPGVRDMYWPGVPYEWQYTAARVDQVPDSMLRAAAGVKIAVVDTGCDLRQPDIAAKNPEGYSVVHPRNRRDVRDSYGHGTFVASLAAGSVTNGEGIAGFGGDAQLLCVQVAQDDGSISDVDESAGIVYAVKHGAKIINLSLGGLEPSALETRAVRYAQRHGVLIVAAAGNEFQDGNPVEYPAALLQPKGSDGRGGSGLSVGASKLDGQRAYFSNAGSYVSLAAPGDDVFAALSGYSDWSRAALPGSITGIYGFSSGTSFAAPEVAGAAALVWAANPALTARQVATILKQTASGHGTWNPSLGFGVLDAAAAIELAPKIGPALPAAKRLLQRLRQEPRPSHSSPPS